MVSEDIIVARSINEISDDLRSKCQLLSEKFKATFNENPKFFARAPGRVNLIGEHIDYCGYSVLPMAIEHDIIIAVSTNTNHQLVLTNFEDNKFKKYETGTSEIEIKKTKPEWQDYFLSGFKGIIEKFNLEKPMGMNICLYGTIPKSAGLSSSSALVVCAALTTLFANELKLTKTELAETCAISERYVGTQGGGMDQAISSLAQDGSAKLIDFNPLRVTNVSLPEGSQFVITNSCVEANKAATNSFNTRVVECRLSSQVLANSQGLDWKSIKKPLDLQKALNKSLLELIEIAKENLHAEDYDVDEICKILDCSREDLVTNSLTQNTLDVKKFQLRKRILHVFSEAQRVYDFKDSCSLTPSEAFEKLGLLMNQSHESCRDLYDCSCIELDELTDICRKSGAYGSRLTGAGWGGCAVSLIPKEKLNEFLDSVKSLYYKKDSKLVESFSAYAFATKPSGGIAVILP